MRILIVAVTLLSFIVAPGAAANNAVCYFKPDDKIKDFWDKVDSGVRNCKPGTMVIIPSQVTPFGENPTDAVVARICDFTKNIAVLNPVEVANLGGNIARNFSVVCVLTDK